MSTLRLAREGTKQESWKKEEGINAYMKLHNIIEKISNEILLNQEIFKWNLIKSNKL